MDYQTLSCIAVFCISLVLTGIIIPQILLIAFRKNLFDVPDDRKIHKGVVPRLGGIAFMPAIFFSLACVLGVSMIYENEEIAHRFVYAGLPLVFGSCSVMLMFLVGMADDLIGVKYRAKFVVQIISALFLCGAGVCIYNLQGFLLITEMPAVFAWLLTILVVVLITNSINLIDGIDGLASGLSSVGLLFYGIVFFSYGYYIYAMIAFAALGTLVPFFYYNVFGNPNRQKKIFMGDTGALTIGIILSFLSITINSDNIGMEHGINPIVIAFSPLILPCFDVLRVYLHRLRKHRNPFLPDKCHIHYKFLALGVPQRIAMLLILMVSIMFVIINIILSPYVNVTILVVINIALYGFSNIALTRAIRSREKRMSQTLYE